MNPFTSVEQTKNDVKLNVWDWSHQFHFTTEIGRLTPCFCARVPAKNSLSISCRHAEQFMPMMFPVQNNIKARVSFFKISVRALWKNYMDWISSVNQLDAEGNPVNSRFVPPFISISTDTNSELYQKFEEYFGTCSNLDYLDLPTTFDTSSLTPSDQFLTLDMVSYTGRTSDYFHSFSLQTYLGHSGLNNDATEGANVFISLSNTLTRDNINNLRNGFKTTLTFTGQDSDKIPSTIASQATDGFPFFAFLCVFSRISPDNITITNYLGSPISNPDLISYTDSVATLQFSAFSSEDLGGVDIPEGSDVRLCFAFLPGVSPDFIFDMQSSITTDIKESFVPSTNYSPETCPWFDHHVNQGLRVSSLPLRFFEAIYNAFYRNDRNNPLSVGGVKKYNDWVLCRDKDGDDSFNYDALSIDGETSSLDYFYGRKYVNWSPDMFTTAVQSPQEGRAPLVGLTNFVTTQQEDGRLVSRLSSVLTDENGDSYNVEFDSDEEGITGVRYTRSDVDPTTKKSIETLFEAVTQGVSIEDFRQVNAYQRYLELNMRRGYSYKDIIEGRYDVNIRYNELLMPEFCGGFTRNVNVNPVTQTTPTDESGTYQGALGSQAGQGFVSGQNQGDINIFCDEDSFVMGIYVCYPEAVYTQHLPKHFLVDNPLDIFSPEFANIGFQPITLKEVAPIQAYNNDKTSLNNVFGYQRPWYDMLQRVNTAHGLYRTQLRNFLMNRVFDGVPQLSKNFLFVKPDQVNDVFSVTETTDKIFGMMDFDIRCKNSVPRNNVPRLE